MKKNRGNPAFTLIEILVAVCIFAIIVVGLGATLSSGLKLWKKANEFSYEEVVLMAEIEMLSKNIRSIFVLEDVPIKGTSNSLEFPVLEGTMIFKNTYSYDAATKKLSLEKTTYEDILEDKEKVYLKKDNLTADSLEFSYLVYDREEEAYSWQDELEEDGTVPLVVKIKIQVNQKEIEEIIFVPIYFYD
jgi:prepilin-type N-terminal cleavage/methylation domain-containing protein